MNLDYSCKEVCCKNVEKLSPKKTRKLNKLKEKYKIHENLIIARQARKTLRFIKKNTENFPNKYFALKNNYYLV